MPTGMVKLQNTGPLGLHCSLQQQRLATRNDPYLQIKRVEWQLLWPGVPQVYKLCPILSALLHAVHELRPCCCPLNNFRVGVWVSAWLVLMPGRRSLQHWLLLVAACHVLSLAAKLHHPLGNLLLP